MKLALTLTADNGDTDLLDAQVAFHLRAGADLILAAAPRAGSARSVLEAYASGGAAVLVHDGDAASEDDLVNRMAASAVTQHGADWVIDVRSGEFWWPRAESLKDALLPIPERYAIVQALVREFVRRPGDGPFYERMVVRHAPVTEDGREPAPIEDALRRAYRAAPGMTVRLTHPGLTNRVPLRAWYPIEVLVAPGQGSTLVDDAMVEQGIADGSFVMDERLHDVLGALRRRPDDREGRPAFHLPGDAPAAVEFPIPDVVDDAAYAADCAAVGEVDLARIDLHIRELEDRIAWLEDRLWPRVMRTLSRLVHRR